MIQVEEQKTELQLRDKRELRDALTPQIGRLIRLSYYKTAELDRITVSQRVARLQEVHFDGEFSASRVYSDQSSELTLHFSTGPKEKIDPGTDTVEVLQEDSGIWRTINMSAGWRKLLDSGYEL